MAGGVFHIADDGALVKLTSQHYDNEDILQKLLEDYPDLLGSDQIGSGDRRWLLVEREVSVPDEDGDTSLALDHLFLDQDGIPTLVEVKRSSDTRIRREVVGQMLDYASNAVARWSVDFLRERFEAEVRRNDRNGDPDGALCKALGVADAEAFWRLVKTNLQAGKIRLLFVADVIPAMLRRIVEFLNEQMDPAEVLAVEVQQYTNDVKGAPRTLVPRVFGQLQKKRSTASAKMTWERFEETIRARGAQGNDFWTAIDDFRKQWEGIGGTFRPNINGMGAYFPLGRNTSAAMFYLDTSEWGILWPLLPGQLAAYANERDDLSHFTPQALTDYEDMIADFPSAFRQPTGARDQVSMAAGNVDLQTFMRFLKMVTDFCAEAFPKRA